MQGLSGQFFVMLHQKKRTEKQGKHKQTIKKTEKEVYTFKRLLNYVKCKNFHEFKLAFRDCFKGKSNSFKI